MVPVQAPDASADPAPAGTAGAAPVDVQRLAERVYRLMLADVRLERARGAAPGAGAPP